MKLQRAMLVGVAAVLAVPILGFFRGSSAERPAAVAPTLITTLASSDTTAAGVASVGDVSEFLAGAARGEWYAGVQRAIDEQAAADAARRAAVAPSNPSGTRPPAGGHSDAWWAGVAQCEQGGRNDPYFGYFSFMDGSAGGKTWEEQVAMGNALLARVSSESPAWAPSCVAAGYRASPGG